MFAHATTALALIGSGNAHADAASQLAQAAAAAEHEFADSDDLRPVLADDGWCAPGSRGPSFSFG
jgi:hypothetical protein